MVIFNMYAILVAIISAICCGIAYLIMPDYIGNDELGIIIYLSITTIVAGICEFAEIKGRVFFLPIWLFSAGGAFYMGFENYKGIKGIFIVIGIMLGLVVGLGLLAVLILFITEKIKWSNAPKKLSDAKDIANLDTAEFWEKINGALINPTFGKLDHLKCRHNVEVLDFMQTMNIEWEEIEPLKQQLEKGTSIGIKADIDDDLITSIEEKLENRIDEFDA